MKRKFVVFASLLMMLPIITTNFAYANPWVEKNNEKFETFYSAGKFNAFAVVGSADRIYVPSFDNVEKIILTWSENYLTYEIKVGGKTYNLITEFVVSGITEQVYWDPVFGASDINKIHPVSSRATHTTNDCTFNFLPASGLEGSFTIRTIVREGNHRTTSLSGTGDFKNVQIQAEVSQIPALPFVTIFNNGLVIGWPE